MQSPLQIPAQALDALKQDSVIICANARAARALSRMYGEQMAAQGRRAWETPQIFDWTQWLHAQWTQWLLSGREDRMLLTSLQEELLWNEIVRPAVESRSLISSGDVARLASSAYARLSTYDATRLLHHGEWDHPSLEQELFRKWALEMERRCQRNHWLCETRLPWAIMDALRDHQLTVPAAIVWNGFDRLTPMDKALRGVLDEAGCLQSELAWDLGATEQLLAAPSIQDEFEACALWARDHLQRSPKARIGVLLPDVANRRADIDRIFRSTLAPDTAQARSVYEFTLGLPLADTPVIAAAITLLQWFLEPQEQETVTWLMITGFFSAERDATMLAEADVRMRKRLAVPEMEIEETLERLAKFTTASGGNRAIFMWVRNMRSAYARLQKMQGKPRSCSEWVAAVTAILKDAGWPGERESRQQDSLSFQVRDRWQRAVEEVSALSFSDRRYDFRSFLALLSSHLRTTIFSPESLDAPITISGIAESAGRCFDAVWICEATDNALPASTRMHPLLPAWLQVQTGMPGSSWELNTTLTSAALDRLRLSSRELVFSYATEDADGAQRPSALVAHLDAAVTEVPSTVMANLLVPFTDAMIVPWPGGRAAGGQSVLKDQSACPFKAFAAKRLVAPELPSLEPGLSPMERGTVVHSTLETLWPDARMKTHANLRGLLFSGELNAVVQEHVTTAMEKHHDLASTDWERSYLRLEQERIGSLVEQWLRKEAARRPFVVESSELNETIVIDGLELNIRMDRIDRTETGRILIDYKTGQTSAGSWDGERLAEPQLPMYAISAKVDELWDVMFAQVTKEKSKFVSAVYGMASDIFPENAVDPDAAARFHEMREEWTRSLHALSREFQQGIATVTPRDYPSTCQHCAFPGLCRVGETMPGLMSGGEDDE